MPSRLIGETIPPHPHPPTIALSRLVNSLKGVSARYIRQEFHDHLSRYLCDGHLWSPSYFAGSCGGPPPAMVQEYVDEQKRPR
jgi:putative transposase